ncbi:hypothetical protein EDD15DRAFT_1886354 [Pisolithus albus]|nr:hypothetical protein EDD15DRAFT_1886354 [Pisolithus albus]
MIVFYNAYSIEATHRVSTVKYDRQFDTLSGIEDIKALQAQLDATKDEDEERALAEDITGKILWLFWCGICVEADELLPKIVEYLRREGSVGHGLREIWSAAPPLDPGDDQAYLQGIMYDAGANTSKYQLWLDARATEQAKWACTDRSTSTVDDQAGSVSPQTLIRQRKI